MINIFLKGIWKWIFLEPKEKKLIKKHQLCGELIEVINNAVTGVSAGHEKILELSGVGYRANLKGEILNLHRFSHDVNFKIKRYKNFSGKTNYHKN